MKNKLIVALDVSSFEKAKKLIDGLSPYVNIFKVGSELFTACGPKVIKYLRKKRKKIFLDLKFHDIPTTVGKAVLAAAGHNVFMLTLHAAGGADMLKKAKGMLKGKKRKPMLLGVTVLTSKSPEDAGKKTLRLAKSAKKAGIDGVVCSAKETRYVKNACGKTFIVVNPGIRPLWARKDLSSVAKHSKYLAKEDDQKRVATPAEAIENGADFIVVGRPITKAGNPALAAKRILKEAHEAE